MAWVVRGGEAKATDLVSGYGLHSSVPGLYGFSVQYQPGKSVDELANAGRFPNRQISYEDEAVLDQAIRPLGYHLQIVPSPGTGYHHTFVVVYNANNIMEQRLPDDVAGALEAALKQIPNPHRIQRGPRKQP